jgi:predicted ferric reductase
MPWTRPSSGGHHVLGTIARMQDSTARPLRGAAVLLMGKPSDWRIRRPRVPSVPAPGISWVGPAAAIASVLTGWWAFKDAVGKEDDVAFPLFIGSVSIMLMAWSNILSTRAHLLEPLFGGLDRAYRWHRWFGALSVAAMWLHSENIDDVKGFAGASRAVAESAEDLAGTATNLVYFLVGISLLRLVPTRWWRITHKFLVVPYVIACWHFWTATKPYENRSPWGVWFGAWMLAGVAAWLVRVVWRDIIRRGRPYRVERVEPDGDATALELEPLGRPVRHKPGQFAFVKVDKKGAREPHPFTIASAPGEMRLRFVIKDLGDWTSRAVGDIKTGDRVTVEGPYGRLRLSPRRRGAETVWIAGGVGITPFLGASVSRRPDAVPLPRLFYCVRTREGASGLDMLEQAGQEGRIRLDLRVSAEGSRLGEDVLRREYGENGLRGAHVVMCGPDALVRDMQRAVRSLGARHVHVEGFDIRSGVGPDLSREIDRLVRRPVHRPLRGG